MQAWEINILIIGFISMLAAVASFFLIKYRKKASYDNDIRKANLDEVRSLLEKQIYILNDRLIQSEERWRDVNHLLLANKSFSISTKNNSKQTYYSEFLKENGIFENDLIVDKRMIFVLTPFHDNYWEDFIVIREVCTSKGFICIRGDETNFKSDIFSQMLKLIVKSSLIIANVNGRNPNVLYELGVAQALDKTVILISKEPEKLPIDIKSKRFLIYSDYSELREMLSAQMINLQSVNE